MVTADKFFLIGGAALVLACSGGVAQAQAVGDTIASGPVSTNFARDRNVSVRQRPRAEYEALGVHAGGFLLFPRVMGTAEHDDNIFALPNNKRSDTILKLQPELTLTSDWSRHFLSLYARSTFSRYQDFKSENTDEWMAGGSGRLDILRDTTLSGAFDTGRLTEPRTFTSTQGQSVVPIQYDQDQANLVFTKEFNRVRASARVDFRAYDYHDGRSALGAAVEQDDRDRDEITWTARGEYALSPATAAFIQGSVNSHNYDMEPPRTPISRDSDGVTVLAGANFELSNLVRGEIGVGYTRQEYDNAAFGVIKGASARAQVEWFPTQLTTVTLNGSRRVEDSGIPGAGGYIASDIAAQIDHELLRNLILTAQASYGTDDYKGLDRKDKQLRFGVSGTYLLNRNVGLTLGYSYYDQNSSGLARGLDYTVNKVGATVTLQY